MEHNKIEPAKGFLATIKTFISDNRNILISLFILITISTFVSDTFLSMNNIVNIMGQLSTNMLLTFSLAIVIILGGIDLSVGPVVASSGIILLLCLQYNIPFYLAVVITLLFGAALGLLNGLIITKAKLAPFIVTLSTTFIIRGIGLVITDGSTLTVGNETLYTMGSTIFFGVLPLSFLVVLIVAFLLFIFMNYTKIGTYIYSIGGGEKASYLSGINIEKVKIISYALSALLAALAGILLAGRMNSASPRIGIGYEAEAVAAAVLGGVSFSGGIGRVSGALLGGIFMGVLNNAMNSMQINESMQFIVKGAILMLAVILDVFDMKRREKRLSRRTV